MQSLLMIHADRFAGILSSNYGIWAAYQNMKRQEKERDGESKKRPRNTAFDASRSTKTKQKIMYDAMRCSEANKSFSLE